MGEDRRPVLFIVCTPPRCPPIRVSEHKRRAPRARLSSLLLFGRSAHSPRDALSPLSLSLSLSRSLSLSLSTHTHCARYSNLSFSLRRKRGSAWETGGGDETPSEEVARKIGLAVPVGAAGLRSGAGRSSEVEREDRMTDNDTNATGHTGGRGRGGPGPGPVPQRDTCKRLRGRSRETRGAGSGRRAVGSGRWVVGRGVGSEFAHTKYIHSHSAWPHCTCQAAG